ncbi:hypothetical protein QM716_28540 [Rhodococcus sp. IEGM 1409]|uniref:hypothetical protein n=1 Tax=Rhodococcus sp. IEGM 1409 TaxID=3047082 RepID=UPI0024B86CA2|nr:hypothetical protein [Rhodococcus sp. IEGM 1409]MDI9903819.1 hypothetical protein [Rhodococcus sp. IEGM 1409]
MKTLLGLIAVAATVITVGGCSSGDDEFKSRSGTQQYDSAQSIADDLKVAGFDCQGFKKDAVTTYSADAGRCFLGDREIVLSVFTSDSTLDQNIASHLGVYEPVRAQYGFLVGSKWMINCGDTTTKHTCRDIKEQLGGRIVKPINY